MCLQAGARPAYLLCWGDDTNDCIERIINLNHCLVSTKLLLKLLPSKLPLFPTGFSDM